MKRIFLLAALIVSSSLAVANPTVESNGVLTNKDGRSLYTFDKDVAGKSNCNGGCATAWPPFLVANVKLAGGDFSVVSRDDGTAQWAFKGMPLYFFAGDQKAGEVNGDNQGGVWHVLRSVGKTAAAAPRPAAGGYGY